MACPKWIAERSIYFPAHQLAALLAPRDLTIDSRITPITGGLLVS